MRPFKPRKWKTIAPDSYIVPQANPEGAPVMSRGRAHGGPTCGCLVRVRASKDYELEPLCTP